MSTLTGVAVALGLLPLHVTVSHVLSCRIAALAGRRPSPAAAGENTLTPGRGRVMAGQVVDDLGVRLVDAELVGDSTGGWPFVGLSNLTSQQLIAAETTGETSAAATWTVTVRAGAEVVSTSQCPLRPAIVLAAVIGWFWPALRVSVRRGPATERSADAALPTDRNTVCRAPSAAGTRR
jgi:hypothetical protein